MRFRTRTAGQWLDAQRWRVFFSGNWRAARRARVYQGSAWRQVYQGYDPLSVSFSPATPLSFGVYQPNQSIAVQAIVAGGAAPFTYLWTVVTSEFPSTILTNSSMATVTASKNGIPSDDSSSAVIRVSITDAVGQNIVSDIPITFFNLAIGF